MYGGGGNSGAQFHNDFIEIFNRGRIEVNLTGWSVQYSSATSGTWTVTPLTNVVLTPGEYYLIQEASGGSVGQNLPTPDASGTINLATSAGKVALLNNSTPLSGTCPANSAIVDLVGYGLTASCFEGTTRAPASANTSAILRTENGCVDTQNNGADFATGTPNPRNSRAPANSCSAALCLLCTLDSAVEDYGQRANEQTKERRSTKSNEMSFFRFSWITSVEESKNEYPNPNCETGVLDDS